MRRISRIAVHLFIVIGLFPLVAGGCSTSGGGASGLFTIQGTSSLATGDWADVSAAVLAAAQHREMGVESESQPDPKTLGFDLLPGRRSLAPAPASVT